MESKRSGVTLFELVIVVIAIGVIAAFAVPGYNRAVRRAAERDATVQLMTLHAANLLYKSKTGSFWQAQTSNVQAINENLGLNLIANADMQYNYTALSPDHFEASAGWAKESGGFTIYINEKPITFNLSKDDLASITASEGTVSYNPCCDLQDQCLSLQVCTSQRTTQ